MKVVSGYQQRHTYYEANEDSGPLNAQAPPSPGGPRNGLLKEIDIFSLFCKNFFKVTYFCTFSLMRASLQNLDSGLPWWRSG